MTEPSKEADHKTFYAAFHSWFMQSNCDFWSECGAPESLATIAVELTDALTDQRVAAAVQAERERIAAATREMKGGWPTGAGDYDEWTLDDVADQILKLIPADRPARGTETRLGSLPRFIRRLRRLADKLTEAK